MAHQPAEEIESIPIPDGHRTVVPARYRDTTVRRQGNVVDETAQNAEEPTASVTDVVPAPCGEARTGGVPEAHLGFI
jgi:hypothetical protein